MSDENKLIQAFLQLQATNHPNLFEAAKKAKKDYDKDGKIESEKDEVWGSRLRAAKMAGKLKEAALKDPKDPSVQGSGDVTMTHIRPTNPDRIKNMKDPRDSSVQGSGEVTKNNKPVRVKEGVADIIKGASTFASDIARAYKGGYGTSARTATGQFTRPGPITGAAQNIARSAGERPAAGAATVGAVGTAAALGSRKSTSQPSSTSSAPSKPEAPEKKMVSAPTPPERPKYMSRAQAFAAARKEAGGAGKKFTYGGKEYQTNIKGEKYSKAPKATSVKEDQDSYAAHQRRMNAAPNWKKEGDWSKQMKKQERDFSKTKKAAEKRKATSVKEENLNEAPMIAPPQINMPAPSVAGQRMQGSRYYAGQSASMSGSGSARFLSTQSASPTPPKLPSYSTSGSGSGSFLKTQSASPNAPKINLPSTQKNTPAPAGGGGGGKEPPIKTTYTRLGDREIRPPSKLGMLGKAAGTVAAGAALGSAMSSRYKEQHGSTHASTPGVSAKDSFERMKSMKAPANPVVSAPTPPERPKYFSRGEAFKAARKEAGGAGKKFTYGGKEYQTNIKGEKYSKAPKATSVKEDEEFDLEGFINEALDVGYTIDDVANYLDETYQLDEVSKEKINRYMKKAVDSYGQKSFNQGVNSMTSGSDSDRRMYKKKAESRQKSMGKAVDKLSGRAKVNATEEVTEDKDPCWKDYKMVGMKNKGNRKVPNCVPKEEVEFSEEELAYFESVAPFDSDETTDSSVSTKSPRRTLTDEKKCKK